MPTRILLKYPSLTYIDKFLGGFSECGTLVKLDQEFITASRFDNRWLNLESLSKYIYFHNFFHRICHLPEEMPFNNQLSI